MPSSTDRKRLEIPTYLHDRLVEIAIDEDRTVASVAQQVIAAGLSSYQPGLIVEIDFSRFSPRAHAAFDAARQETTHFNHNFIGTEHLLLGLLKIEEGFAARVLGNLGVDYARTFEFMRTHIKRGEGYVPPPMELRLAPRAKRALHLSIEETDKLGQNHVGTEHLLLGLTRVRYGVAAAVLAAFGVLDAIRDEAHAEMERHAFLWGNNMLASEDSGKYSLPAKEADDAR